MNYVPDLWHDFAVTVGGLAGALTGLLFVALSIKGEALAASVSLRSRAAQTLVLFLTSAITTVVLVAPQPRTAAAVELLVLAALSGAALFVLDRRAGHDAQSSVARYIERASPNSITSVLTGIAGLTVLLRSGGGLYWLIPAVLAGLVGGVINAWLFLLRVPGGAGTPAGASASAGDSARDGESARDGNSAPARGSAPAGLHRRGSQPAGRERFQIGRTRADLGAWPSRR